MENLSRWSDARIASGGTKERSRIMDTATPPNTDTIQETGKLVFTEPTKRIFSALMERGEKMKLKIEYLPKEDLKPYANNAV